jgi:microcystin-dependent protein
MSLSPILSRDIVATRLMFNMMKRNKYEDYLKDTIVGDLKWSAITDNSLAVRGWLKCDGSSVSRTTYSALFAIIGTTYGSVNGSSFNLPNCKGRVLAATGQPYNTATTLAQGNSFGYQTHTLSVNEMPSHTHTGHTDQNTDTPESETVVGSVTAVHSNAVVSGANQHTLTFTTNATGGSQAFDIQQPTIVVGDVFIYTGVFEPIEPTVDIIGPDDPNYNA